jgi:hypothetical protein
LATKIGSNVDELIAESATVTSGPQLAAMVGFWVGRLPLPEAMPPATVGNARRLDQVDTVCWLGRSWRNCLASYGWLLDEVKGPRNSEVEPSQFALIGTAFADVGVPSSQVVRAIENIIHADSGALRPMDEDW